MDERLIEVEKIEQMLTSQFNEVIQEDAFLRGVKFKIANEQQFVLEKSKEPNTIYIVFKLSSSSLDYGQVIMPITLIAISEYNGINRCQRLLLDFAQKYNIQWDGEQTIRQFWENPNSTGNFEELYDGFRTTFYMSGALVISKNANFLTIYNLSWGAKVNGEDVSSFVKWGWFESYFYSLEQEQEEYVFKYITKEKWLFNDKENKNFKECLEVDKLLLFLEKKGIDLSPDLQIVIKPNWNNEIKFLNYGDSTVIQPDSQVFQTTKNFVKTIGMYGSNSISLNTYLLDEDFCNKCLAIKTKKLNLYPDGVDTKFYLKFSFTKKDYEFKDVYVMTSFSLASQIREIPSINVTFTN